MVKFVGTRDKNKGDIILQEFRGVKLMGYSMKDEKRWRHVMIIFEYQLGFMSGSHMKQAIKFIRQLS